MIAACFEETTPSPPHEYSKGVAMYLDEYIV
jgi:hypothetical protein